MDLKEVAKLIKFPRCENFTWEKKGGHAGVGIVSRVCLAVREAGLENRPVVNTLSGTPDGNHVNKDTRVELLKDGKVVAVFVAWTHLGVTASENRYFMQLREPPAEKE